VCTQCSPCPRRHLPRRRPPRRLCPLRKAWGSIASSVLRKHTQKGKILDAKRWGKTDILHVRKQSTWVRLVKYLTLHGSRGEPRSLPREEKSKSPLLNVHILQTSKHNEEKTIETKKTTTASHDGFRRSTSEACPHSTCRALLRRSTDAT
jgi:hypothetical protein